MHAQVLEVQQVQVLEVQVQILEVQVQVLEVQVQVLEVQVQVQISNRTSLVVCKQK